MDKLGQAHINLQMNDVNNTLGEPNQTFLGSSGIARTPESVDVPLGEPPIIGDVKVGLYRDLNQAQDLADVVANVLVKPRTFPFLRGPYTNDFSATPEAMNVLTRADFDFVYYTGPWRRNPSF